MSTDWPATWPPPAAELIFFDAHGDVLLILSRCVVKNETEEEDDVELGGAAYVIDQAELDDLKDLNVTELVRDSDGEMDRESTLPGYSRATERNRSRCPSSSRVKITEVVHMRASSRHRRSLECLVLASEKATLYRAWAQLSSLYQTTIQIPSKSS